MVEIVQSNHEKPKEVPGLMIPDLIKALSRSEIDVNELKNLKLELSNWLVEGNRGSYPLNHTYQQVKWGGIDVILAMIDHGAPKNRSNYTLTQ